MHYRAIIIGAGQAGLAAAHELLRRGYSLGPDGDVLALDANDGPGGAWRHRWDSLTLGKAHGIADLPGLPMDRPDPQVPASRLVADYYGTYEDTFDLQVLRPAPVRRVDPGSPLTVTLIDDRVFTADLVLNATGTWDNPFIPYIPGIENFRGRQLHTKDYVRKEDFVGQRTLVVGGGLSAVQFLLELAPVTETVWATHRPPNFTQREFDAGWGLAVEEAVRERTFAGRRPASVVRTTGIPQIPAYLDGVAAGTLVSRGMFDRVTETGVVFGPPKSEVAAGYGPSRSNELQVPESWDPLPVGTEMDVDIIFWNTGFRPALRHLAPLKLRGAEGGIRMLDEVTPAADDRILLVGYGSTASTVGATRAGRLAGRRAARILQQKVDSAA
ncbi:Predicted flavoprotein CzcO associated with the cation diffusion facilitator CzcD [Corynebacterium pollutisoli]|uniref:Predicted flavoprotein CzcO associated with the cation diffusion facilitator CzcD n=1 Tax=Corynebacterium pollutisoli TaxID=1610489 RepID=A0A1X7J139_9CORY|nr:NAD(P)-binding domain-containing protein [Corynebacterium pollutisoli]SMG21044.1 Predicted flavoprotein CzcO associated with the cation diffusion facilitator CzcD [Corynebacterium pollutisoli]